MPDTVQILKGKCHRCGQTDTVEVYLGVSVKRLVKAISDFAKGRRLHEQYCTERANG